MPDLIHRHQWFHGPEFLSQQTVREEVEPPGVSIDDEPQVKREITVCATNARDTERDVMNDLITRYLSWEKLKGSLAWLLRCRVYLHAEARKKTPMSTEMVLSEQELHSAERAVF